MTDYRSPLEPRTVDTAEGDAATRLAATHKALGMVPNMYAVMANSPGLLATYLDGYQWFRSASGFTPGEQEAVFLTISRFNESDYCMAAHRRPSTPPTSRGSSESTSTRARASRRRSTS